MNIEAERLRRQQEQMLLDPQIEGHVFEHLAAAGPCEMTNLALAVSYKFDQKQRHRIAISDVARACATLVARGDAKCTRVRQANRSGDDGARLVWHLPDQTPTVAPPRRVAKRVHTRGPTPLRSAGRVRRKREPHTNDKPEPIEILARMAGRTNFITPKATASSTATVPVTPLDIAHAIATAEDKFGATMAMAIACQRPQEFDRAERSGLSRVLRVLRGQRTHPGIVKGPRKYLARIAFEDAFDYLVAPAEQPSWNVGAKRRRLRREIYKFLVNEAIGVLEGAANTAAKDAVDFLFGNHLRRFQGRAKRSTVVMIGGAMKVIENVPLEDFLAVCALSGIRAPLAFDVDELMAEIVARPRASGVLTLRSEPA